MTDRGAIREFVIKSAKEVGIDQVGICSADPIDMERLGLAQSSDTPNSEKKQTPKIPRYANPRAHLKGAKSIISACYFYYDGYRETNPLRGEIAAYTRSNYYEALRRKMVRLGELLKARYAARFKAFSCYVSLAEKPIAVRAGLGYYGKHGIVITQRFGSYVVLGEILTDLEIKPHDMPIENNCGNCDLCIKACPTGAIVAPYIVDRKRCLQYISERTCIVPHWMRRIWGNRLYGCTTCQDVCPRNSNVPPTKPKDKIGYVGPSFPLAQIIKMDEGTFQSTFANNQIGMRNRNAIRRNAIIAAGNSHNKSLLPVLIDASKDEDFMIRLHSYWAIAMIEGVKAESILERALKSENNALAGNEIKTLLDGLSSFG